MQNSSTRKMDLLISSSCRILCLFMLAVVCVNTSTAQTLMDSTAKVHPYKNVIRYNLSGALIFGIDKYVVFGYERIIRRNQSISVNFGKASLPKIVSITTDSFSLNKEANSSGTNVSIDYRFYLPRENKYLAPHGLYIGPYYSYNDFNRDNRWDYKTRNSFVNTHTDFSIHTIGFELGYQLILWKRFTIDFLMVGPGVGFYDYKVSFDGNLDAATQEQLLDGLGQLLKQKFPGMNFVLSDKEISSNGTLKTTALGYRYLIQIGFNF